MPSSNEFIYVHRENTYIHGHILKTDFFPNNPLHIYYLAMAVSKSGPSPIKVEKMKQGVDAEPLGLTTLAKELFEDFCKKTQEKTTQFKDELEIANRFIKTHSKEEKLSEANTSLFAHSGSPPIHPDTPKTPPEHKQQR